MYGQKSEHPKTSSIFLDSISIFQEKKLWLMKNHLSKQLVFCYLSIVRFAQSLDQTLISDHKKK